MRRHYALLHTIRKRYAIVTTHYSRFHNYCIWRRIFRAKYRRNIGTDNIASQLVDQLALVDKEVLASG